MRDCGNANWRRSLLYALGVSRQCLPGTAWICATNLLDHIFPRPALAQCAHQIFSVLVAAPQRYVDHVSVFQPAADPIGDGHMGTFLTPRLPQWLQMAVTGITRSRDVIHFVREETTYCRVMETPVRYPVCGADTITPVRRTVLAEGGQQILTGVLAYRCSAGHLFRADRVISKDPAARI